MFPRLGDDRQQVWPSDPPDDWGRLHGDGDTPTARPQGRPSHIAGRVFYLFLWRRECHVTLH